MSTSTLMSFEVDTYASKRDRRKITVLAKNEAAARAAAVAGHRTVAGLPTSASVLTTGCRVIDPVLALKRAGRLPHDGDDAA